MLARPAEIDRPAEVFAANLKISILAEWLLKVDFLLTEELHADERAEPMAPYPEGLVLMSKRLCIPHPTTAAHEKAVDLVQPGTCWVGASWTMPTAVDWRVSAEQLGLVCSMTASERLDLRFLAHNEPGPCSGGQRYRLSTSRTLATKSGLGGLAASVRRRAKCAAPC